MFRVSNLTLHIHPTVGGNAEKNKEITKNMKSKKNYLIISLIFMLFVGNIYSQTKYTGYYYSVNLDDYTSFKYTREYKENGSVYKTIYKIYHPTKGTHIYTVIAEHFKSKKKIVVKSLNSDGGTFALLNEEETTYDKPSMEFFGYGGIYAVASDSPNQLMVKFISNKYENIKVAHLFASKRNSDYHFFILDEDN